MHQVRAAALIGYPDVAASVGLDGWRLLREAGLSPDMLRDPENRLPAGIVAQLLARSAEQSGCDHFGLLMAEARSFASLGPLSLLLEHLPNVREVVLAMIAFQPHLNDVVTTRLESDGESELIEVDLLPPYRLGQICDQIVGITFGILTGASGGRWSPDCVHFMRPAPDDQSEWRRFFRAPLEFASAFNGLSSSPAAMQTANPLADEAMARNARHLLERMPMAREPPTMGDRVRELITLLLPTGQATLPRAAAQLGLSSRSLQRQLARRGLSFADLLDAVRRERARGYLASPRPVTEVAGLLGYASPSAFSRWFAAAYGMSPQAWRRRPEPSEPAGPPPVWKR